MVTNTSKKLANQPRKKKNRKQESQKHSKSVSNKVVLVPVDFYHHSEAALRFAATMADLMGARLLILHVVHDPVDVPGFYIHEAKKERRLRRMEDVASEMLANFLKKMTNDHPNLPAMKKAETKLVLGLPVTRILEIVEEIRPKCVVMGSQGRTKLAQVFVGSTAENVVHLCPVPVTIVKSKHFLATS